LDRRRFLGIALASLGGVAAARLGLLDSLPVFGDAAAATDVTRYGPLATQPDANSMLLPAGFRSRVLARGGEVVKGTSYQWHPYPDGGGVRPTAHGGWIYANNSEVVWPGEGGASAIRFNRKGVVVDAYRILSGTTSNCAGGMMPWGSWLSCEENEEGRVWECDPLGRRAAVVRPAMGTFPHEAAAADRVRKVVYMTEDAPDGLLYRFRPDRWHSLKSGVLEAAAVDANLEVGWLPVPDPSAKDGPARASVPGATQFPGAEGVVVHGDSLYFTTKYDNHVRRLDLVTSQLSTIWDGREPLTGVDNLAIHKATRDLYACEDGGDMQIVVIAPDGGTAPFLQILGQDESEITGVAFDPSGTRLYFNSQRGPTPKRLPDVVPGTVDDRPLGITFEVTGPFVSSPGSSRS
jgi:secreted PhoX family phosphatase